MVLAGSSAGRCGSVRLYANALGDGETLSYVYFASDDGAYRWNGSTDELLTRAITHEYLRAANRDDMGSALWNNR